jgi:periplasmic divalent cation tolerance protein
VLGPVLSAFWHNEEFGEGEEWRAFLKTEAEQDPHLAHLRVNHPWDKPEITAHAVADGSAAYLDWISRTVS